MRFEIRGPGNLSRKYTNEELGAAMDTWDESVEAALPGDKLQLVNLDTGRIVSEYINMKQPS
jgi:hypothetical protein